MLKMSFNDCELPKRVSSVNGKHDAISIEGGGNSIVVDNSQGGKIKLKVGGSGGDVVRWENGNTINNPSIQLIGGDPTTGHAIYIMSTHDMYIAAENDIELNAGIGSIYLNTGGSVTINQTTITIDANGITFTNGGYTNFGTIQLK
jgi:hypothetical protein